MSSTDDSFAVLFRSMEDGAFSDGAGAELRAALVALRKRAADTNLRAKGALTITVKLEMDPKGVLETEGQIAVKLPKPVRGRSIHWTDIDGDILNRKPEKQLELRAVATKAEPANEAPKAISV